MLAFALIETVLALLQLAMALNFLITFTKLILIIKTETTLRKNLKLSSFQELMSLCINY